MLQSIEAVVNQNGKIRTLEPIKLPPFRRITITILDEEVGDTTNLVQLSVAALANDWARPEEDEARSHLGQLPSI